MSQPVRRVFAEKGDWGNIPSGPTGFEEAIKSFQKRLVMSEAEALALGADASYKAFWVGGGLHIEDVGRVFDSIDKAIESGEPFEDWKERVKGKFASDAHAETVFRNATQHAYSAGRHIQLTDPEILKSRPYWQHDSVLDSGTTQQCRALDGLVFPVDHPHWRTHWPPGHHRCRRSIRSLRKSQAERKGITTNEPEVTVPEGWGRLPPAKPVWKPKPKTKERKRLTGELDHKKAKKDQKKPPKAKPAPKPKPAQVAPLVAKSKEFEKAVLDQDWSAARNIIREQIEFARPGTVSKDVEWFNRTNAGKVVVQNQEGALGSHGWDGSINLGDRAHGFIVQNARHLAAGTYQDPATYKLKDMPRLMHYINKNEFDPVVVLSNGLGTIIHEEIHGTTRLLAKNYRGANAVLEEVGVELNARLVVRSIDAQVADFKGPITFVGAEPYDDYIAAVDKILLEEAPSLPVSKKRIVHFADAFQAGVMGKGEAFATQNEYIDAIVDNLPTTESERAKVKKRFLEFKATHLPPVHQ